MFTLKYREFHQTFSNGGLLGAPALLFSHSVHRHPWRELQAPCCYPGLVWQGATGEIMAKSRPLATASRHQSFLPIFSKAVDFALIFSKLLHLFSVCCIWGPCQNGTFFFLSFLRSFSHSDSDLLREGHINEGLSTFFLLVTHQWTSSFLHVKKIKE